MLHHIFSKIKLNWYLVTRFTTRYSEVMLLLPPPKKNSNLYSANRRYLEVSTWFNKYVPSENWWSGSFYDVFCCFILFTFTQFLIRSKARKATMTSPGDGRLNSKRIELPTTSGCFGLLGYTPVISKQCCFI